MALLLETIWGDLVIDLDVQGSPELCKNLLKLAKVRYYTHTLIFAVTQNRFCQAGDPAGDGTGGACIYGLLTDDDDAGTTADYRQSPQRFLRSVGRALTSRECQEKGRVVATTLNHTPDTIGSQFLITTAGGPDRALDGYSAVGGGEDVQNSSQFLSLGVVAEDENGVLDKINAAYTDPSGRPYADIRIIRALVLHDPFDDVPGMDRLMDKLGVKVKEGRVADSPSPERPAEERVAKRMSAADVVVDDESEDEEERKIKLHAAQEEAAKKEDKSRAVVLEMLGDLPDAEIRAPEDTLFICKLNPATVDEDLELILSRFDEDVKVEIIRDPITGASLQYAFAEFTSKQAAVEAYFKMNNALVDDRRIKVDFSQSVAKLWDKYKQKLRMPADPGGASVVRGTASAGRGAAGGGRGRGGPGRGGHGGSGPPRDHGNSREHAPNHHHQQQRDAGRDDFGRSSDFRPRAASNGRSNDDHGRPEQVEQRRSKDRDHQFRSGDEWRRRDDYDDSGDDRRRKKHRKKERRSRRDSRRRHDSDGGSSDAESERSGRGNEPTHRHRHHEDRRTRRGSESRSGVGSEGRHGKDENQRENPVSATQRERRSRHDSDVSDGPSHKSDRGHSRKAEMHRRRDGGSDEAGSEGERPKAGEESDGSCESGRGSRLKQDRRHRRARSSDDRGGRENGGERHKHHREHRKRDRDVERKDRKRSRRSRSRS